MLTFSAGLDGDPHRETRPPGANSTWRGLGATWRSLPWHNIIRILSGIFSVKMAEYPAIFGPTPTSAVEADGKLRPVGPSEISEQGREESVSKSNLESHCYW